MLSFISKPASYGAVPAEICLALVLNFLVALAVWPGFMSWDSLFALKEVREGIIAAAFPPMVSYVWYLPDLLIPGPGGMLLLQNGVLLVGLGLILYLLRASLILSLALLVLFVATPIIVGPMLVVWKDIGMSACLMMSVALIVYAAQRGSLVALGFAFLCLVIGGCYRLNAFPALLPIGFAGVLALGERLWPDRKNWCKLLSIWAGAMLVVLVVAAASVSFRLPDFKPLPKDFGAKFFQLYDLEGISLCTRENLVPDGFFLRPMSVDDLQRVFKPQHLQLAFRDGDPDYLQYVGFRKTTDLESRWLKAIIAHPGCYLMERIRLMSYLVGANSQPVFYPTHNGIDENSLGIKMQATPLTDRVVRYINNAAQPQWGFSNALARGWIWWVTATVACTLLFIRRRPTWQLAGLLYLSGVLYLAGSFPLIPAADARYAHWFFITCFLAIALAATDGLCELREKRNSQPALSEGPSQLRADA